MRRVLHDVVHHVANLHGEGQVHRGRHKRLCFGPGGFVVVPRHAHMGVVNVDHKTNHGVPEQERYHHAHEQGECHRLTSGHRGIAHYAYPQSTKHGDQHAVFEEDGTACGHVRFVGKELALPPNFNEVVKARCPTTAVQVLKQAVDRAQCRKLFCRQRCPNKVHTLQVGVAMVHHVVAGVPQTVGGE